VGGKLTQNPNVPIPGTKYKRSNSIFLVTSIALICRRVWSQLLQSLPQSLIRGPGTLVVPLPNLSSGTNNWEAPPVQWDKPIDTGCACQIGTGCACPRDKQNQSQWDKHIGTGCVCPSGTSRLTV